MYRNSTFIVKIIFSLILLIYASCDLLAQVPNTISYQGVLKDANGTPLTGSYNLLFKIYQSETGGTEIWQENQTDINVQNGIFNVVLGNLGSIAFDQQYWLGIIVNGGQELTPRTFLTAVPYALMTKSISNNSVTTAKIVNNEVTPEKINTTGASNGYALIYDGSNLVWKEPSGGLNLPFGANYNGSSNAIDINHGGSQGNVLFLTTSNSNNSDQTIKAFSSGTGGVADFRYTNSNTDATVLKIINDGLGAGIWVKNSNSNNSSPALWGRSDGSGYAGFFEGDVFVAGELSKLSGSFVIDHPLDPENKILRHSFVESPEMLNIYKGRAKLNNGMVAINLPNYFDALNSPEGREVNLTPVNGWTPLYLDGKIDNNQFTIRTTKDGNQKQEFSWVIYGVRNDKYAQDHPLVVEEEKGVNNNFKKGELINPDDVHAKLLSENKNKTHNTREH